MCDLLRAVHRHAVEAHKGSEITMTAQPTEAPRSLSQACGDPADEHAAIPPATDVADKVADEAVEVLDRVRTPEHAVERAGDAEPLERERLVQAFAQRSCGTPLGVIERGRELEEAALGEGSVREAIRCSSSTALGQVRPTVARAC